jgi:hypothetical protein
MSALVSSIGSVIVIASFVVCKKWRKRLAAAKAILFVTAIFDFFAAGNYFFPSTTRNAYCRFQASSIQVYLTPYNKYLMTSN